jgi:hypothetical protein
MPPLLSGDEAGSGSLRTSTQVLLKPASVTALPEVPELKCFTHLDGSLSLVEPYEFHYYGQMPSANSPSCMTVNTGW